jgi:photosystem II stability/assembly factor-like uncharacterized protein
MYRICKIVIGVAFACGAAGMAQSQDTWIRQSALPVDRNPTMAFALSPERAFFVGEDLLILETTTAGASWNVRNLGPTEQDPYYAIHFATPTVGIITGNNSALRTSDGGATWQSVANFPAGSWSYLDFIDGLNGYAGANGACAATTDGGLTWVVRSGYPDCPIMFGMDFRDVNVGLAGGILATTSESGIFKTTDGGRTWAMKSPNAANDVLWLTSTRAIADFGTTMRQSLDAGESWQTIASGIESGVLSLARAGNSNVVVGVSGKGDVWRSGDGGFSWLQTFDGPGALPEIWEVHFADALHGWVVGPGGFYYYTSDSGLTWQQKNTGCTAQVLDIQMLTPDYGLAVGYNGYVFRTTNGGGFWDIQKLEVTGQVWGRDEGLAAVDVVDSQFAVAAGPGGTVFKTANGGVSWTSIGYPKLPTTFNIFDVDFIDSNLGYVYGIDEDLGHTKTFYRTRDGGSSWEWVYLGERGGGTTLQFIDSQRGWLTADNRFGLRTSDGGNTWTEFYLPDYFTSPEVSKVRFLDANQGWAVGWDGYVAKTGDGGTSWTRLDLGTITDHFFDVMAVSSNDVWICGRESSSFAGVMYHSTNGGQSWSRQVVTDWFYYPYRVSALPGGHVWFGGYSGTIFRKEPSMYTVPPLSYTFVRGSAAGGGLSDLFNSDDSWLIGAPSPFFALTSDPIELVVNGTSPLTAPAAMNLQIESRVSPGRTMQRVEFWNFATSAWELVYSGDSTATDSTITVPAPGSVARFVEPGTQKVRAKVRWRPGVFSVGNWRASIDRIAWQIYR